MDERNHRWAIGQRYVSAGEPALGLGTVKSLKGKIIEISFPAANAVRRYAWAEPPLNRVVFQKGDLVRNRRRKTFRIVEVREQNDILFYLGDTEILPETELADDLSFSQPDQVLLAGRLQTPRSFDVRRESWEIRAKNLTSPCRGLTGARIELIPHQIYVAWKVGRRFQPRVLLCDEVGLGKTVEAGLIFHQLHVTGQVKRCLCLVPQSLLHQWLVEFLRKFNHLFQLMNQGVRMSAHKAHPGMNPYETYQHVLQSIDDLLAHPRQCREIVEADWDLVIVDEAHHLKWAKDKASDGYRLVEALSRRSGALILITATPRQLGLETHYALLRLLDPNRFSSLTAFKKEIQGYGALAELVIEMERQVPSDISQRLEALIPGDPTLHKLARRAAGDAASQKALLASLIDRHGTGRMVFRNRRGVVEAFLPQRRTFAYPLEPDETYRAYLSRLAVPTSAAEAQNVLSGPAAAPQETRDTPVLDRLPIKDLFRHDPRIIWLIDFLREHPSEKSVLICADMDTVLAIEEALFPYRDIRTAVFHEGLGLIERDRQAAYFATDLGAGVLLCSEIGSEGRNFQFARHLILFDLPLHPGLLEQRIGRLDRIGQHHPVHIHLPYVRQTLHERVYIWYAEGLGGFDRPILCADELHTHLIEEIRALIAGQPGQDLAPLIAKTRRKVHRLYEKVERGRDRLLERHSFDADQTEMLLYEIRTHSGEQELRQYMDRLFDIFGVEVIELDDGTQFIEPGSHMYIESFPNLPHEGFAVTYDRAQAVAREDLQFLTLEHPLVMGGMDLILSQDRGVASVGLWKNAPTPGLLLECLFVVETIDSDAFRAAHFLPPTPLHFILDQNCQFRDDLRRDLAQIRLEKGPQYLIRQQREALEEIFAKLLERARNRARKRARIIIEDALQRAEKTLTGEYERLCRLQEINPSVRQTELDYVTLWRDRARAQIANADLRLDAVRLVLMTP